MQVVVARADGNTGGGVADLGEEVEVTERVTGLTFGDRAEQRGDVGVTLDVGLLREVEVPAVRLALARERGLQVVVGLGSIELGHLVLLLWAVGLEMEERAVQEQWSQRPRKITCTASTVKSRR